MSVPHLPHPVGPAAGPGLSDAAAERYAFDAPSRAWYAVGVFCALQLSSNMDRQVISLVVEPLRRDFGLDDVQIGLLQGLAFGIFYALVALPIGWAADRWSRSRIVLWGATFWTLAAFACMFARDYASLFVARMLVGLGEAALLPAAFSMLGDYFPRSRVAGSISIVTGASYLGAGSALAFGGLFLAQLPTSGQVTLPLGGTVHGWQTAFGVVALPGLLMLPFAAALREPPRRAVAAQPDGASFGEALAFLSRNARFWLPLIFGMVLLAAYQWGVTAWVVAFFMRHYGWNTAQIGLLYGVVFIVVGTVASIIGGRWCDRMIAAGRRDATFRVPLIAGAMALPLTVAFALCDDARLSAVLLVAITFFGVVPFGPGLSSYPLFAPNRMRAQLIALHLLLSTLVGSGVGPWLTAFVTERVLGGPAQLHRSIAISAALLLVPAIASLAWGSRLARRQPLDAAH